MFYKICGMTRQQDLDVAAELGFALCGFIFHAQSPRGVTVRQAAALESHGMKRVGVFVEQSVQDILETVDAAGLDLVQLHGRQDEKFMNALAERLGKERIVRVFWPERYADKDLMLKEIEAVQPCCRLVLLDAGKTGGGHGVRLDLSFLKDGCCPAPWMLAGGLKEDVLSDLTHVPEEARPCGLDFNSGLEAAPGCKDEALMRSLMAEAERTGLAPEPF